MLTDIMLLLPSFLQSLLILTCKDEPLHTVTFLGQTLHCRTHYHRNLGSKAVPGGMCIVIRSSGPHRKNPHQGLVPNCHYSYNFFLGIGSWELNFWCLSLLILLCLFLSIIKLFSQGTRPIYGAVRNL